MIFYGDPESIKGWKALLKKGLGKKLKCGPTKEEKFPLLRHHFEVELTKVERQFMQDVFWYKIEKGVPWNRRITFLE